MFPGGEGVFTCGGYLAARMSLLTGKKRGSVLSRFSWGSRSRSLCDNDSIDGALHATTGAMNGYPPPMASTWREVKHADGRAYYHNTATNETSWEKPDELKDEVEVRRAAIPRDIDAH